MILYYKPGSAPGPRPARIILQNGLSRNEYSEEELLQAGYLRAPSPPQAQFPQRTDWSNGVWTVRDPNESEINQRVVQIKQECASRLAASDYRAIKAAETGVPLSDAWRAYRQRLRDIYNLIEVPDIWHVVWPEAPGDN